ncbi:MAG: hypothetical protein A3G24_20100 [Betaproteobacteria bacterium RIFCSPLOWO2_12_FULL_62_13]|nr:MAG: hypothetical protein A3G24_20100 [Betaproteobacteria bacterium RIFCSPLOWO2_12_FULL_62_13]
MRGFRCGITFRLCRADRVGHEPGLEANLLSVCFTAVSNRNNIDQAFPIGYTIDHSPVAHPNAPEVGSTFKLFHTARTRLHRESLDALDYAGGNSMIQGLKFFTR